MLGFGETRAGLEPIPQEKADTHCWPVRLFYVVYGWQIRLNGHLKNTHTQFMISVIFHVWE